MQAIKEIDVPDDWDPIEYLCYPRDGSKAYKHSSGANVHIINMYDTGKYIAQKEDENGVFEEEKWVSYDRAVAVIEDWMGEY